MSPLLMQSVLFVSITACAILLFILSRAKPWIKALATVLAGFAYVLHFNGISQLPGWPSDDELPPKFELLGARILEPRVGEQTQGWIEIWIRQPGQHVSRLHRLSYQTNLHDELLQAEEKRKAGKPQYGRISSSQGALAISFIDKPKTLLPAKTGD